MFFFNFDDFTLLTFLKQRILIMILKIIPLLSIKQISIYFYAFNIFIFVFLQFIENGFCARW